MTSVVPPVPYGRPPMVSRGPWFRQAIMEDDGLEYYYKFKTGEGTKYLLSNNIPYKEREELENLYTGYKRNYYLSSLGGLYASYEIVSRLQYFKKMASGWKFLSFILIGTWLSEEIRYYSCGYYFMPLLNAKYKKYSSFAKSDMFDIVDEKRQWFELDTSQYMDYTFDDLDHHHHKMNHGPQPDGEVLNNSWFTEYNKYLKGEPSKLKEHPKFRNYNFEYSDKYTWPSLEKVKGVFEAPEVAQATPESLKGKDELLNSTIT